MGLSQAPTPHPACFFFFYVFFHRILRDYFLIIFNIVISGALFSREKKNIGEIGAIKAAGAKLQSSIKKNNRKVKV